MLGKKIGSLNAKPVTSLSMEKRLTLLYTAEKVMVPYQ